MVARRLVLRTVYLNCKLPTDSAILYTVTTDENLSSFKNADLVDGLFGGVRRASLGSYRVCSVDSTSRTCDDVATLGFLTSRVHKRPLLIRRGDSRCTGVMVTAQPIVLQLAIRGLAGGPLNIVCEVPHYSPGNSDWRDNHIRAL